MREHEPLDFGSRTILAAAGVLVAVVAVSGLALHWIVPQPRSAERNAQLAPAPPAPRLQRTPVEDLAAYRRAKDAELHDYAWIDRRHGVVRIPIERAMQLTAERRGVAP